MSQVISFENYVPIERYDATAWEQVRIYEAASATGPWTLIDTVDLDPIDADPTDPAERNITTAAATDEQGLWYRFVWVDGATNVSSPTDAVQNVVAAAARDLCTLDDVLSLVPGYQQSDTVEAKLQQLITEESELIQEVREIVAASAQPEERDFDISQWDQQSGEINVGDLATMDDLEAEIRTADGDTVVTVDVDDVTPVYRFGRLQPRTTWEPIVALRFRRHLTCNRVLHLTATFGFPAIPPHIRQATAKRVLLRYLSDVAAREITDAVANLNLAAMFASARDSIESLDDGVYIA